MIIALNIIPPMLHSQLSLPHEICDSSHHAAHYHKLSPTVGASFLTWYWAGLIITFVYKFTVYDPGLHPTLQSHTFHLTN
jgi:hypothetical protein